MHSFKRVRKINRKAHTPKQQDELQNATNTHQNTPNTLQSNIMNLQGLVGNQATIQLMQDTGTNLAIQRMPVRAEVINKLGNPKKHRKDRKGRIKKENSTKYRAVLDSLEVFETYIQSNFLSQEPDGIRAQMVRVNQLLQAIYTAMSAYKDKGKKGKYMNLRRDEVKDLQGIAARAFLEKMDHPSAHAFLAPSLTSFLNSAQHNAGAAPIQLDADDKVGSARGGTKEVSKFDMGDGKQGYFNENQDTLSAVDPSSDEWNDFVAELRAAVKLEGAEKGWDDEKIADEVFLRKNALMNEYYIGVSSLGINPDDARMNKRDIAMSRLDQLFNTQLIARAQMAVVNFEDGSKLEGTIMADAGGGGAYSPKDILGEGTDGGFANKQELMDHRQAGIGMDDPELMRQLSRLYLLDLIASQVDRNTGNYFIHRGADGELLSITGIDNDFAFGTKETADITTQELNGISRYVDKELATTIISLDANILEPILSDLLPPNEVQAAIKRMQDLQSELKKDETNLLEPDEWLAHRDAILDEGKDYYSTLGSKIRDARGVKYHD